MEIRKRVTLKTGHKIFVFEYKPFKGSIKNSIMITGKNGSMSVKSLQDARKVIKQGKV